MLGLPKGIVRLYPYNSQWIKLYEVEKRHIRKIIGNHITAIHHFGSTAVPGLISKPIIDIAVAVDSLDRDVALCEPLLRRSGYEYHGNFVVHNSYFFSKGDPTTHHLHFAQSDSVILKKWLYFRDQLRLNKSLGSDYQTLKESLQQQFATDRNAYGKGKDTFIESALDAADDSGNAP